MLGALAKFARELLAVDNQALVDALPISVALRDTECRFVQVNRMWEQYFGLRREEVIGKRFSELPGWNDNPDLIRVAREAEAVDRELMARGPGAPPVFLEDTRLGRTYILGRQLFTDAAGKVTGLLATGVDTTELRETQRALATERERLALLVRSTRAGFTEWDAKADRVLFSGRFKEMLGHPPDADTAGWRIFELMHPDDAPAIREQFLRMVQPRGGASPHEPTPALEYRLRRADGRHVWVRAEGLLERDEGGAARRFIASYVDITALRESEERYDLALRATNEGVYDWNIAAGTVFYSDNVYNVLGAPRSMQTPEDWRRRIHPDDRAQYDAAMVAHFKGYTPRFECEYRYAAADGSWRWALQHGIAVRDKEGRAIRMIGATGDVTDRKSFELRLRDQIALTSALIDNNPNAMYLKDTQGRYMRVNDAWLSLVGVTREQALGRSVRELFPEAESDRYHAEDMRLLAGEERESEMESHRTGPGGESQWVIIRKRVLKNAQGEVIGLLGTNTDITRLKKYEAELASRANFVAELIDAMPMSIAMRDTQGRYMLVNRAWEDFFGVKRDEVIGKRRRELPGWTNPSRLADADEVERIDREILERGPGYDPAPQETLRFGRYYLITRRAIYDAGRRPIGVLSAGVDMTERRQMEERLRDQYLLTQTIIQENPTAMYLKDIEGRYVTVNDAFVKMFGVTREQVIGRTMKEVFADEPHRDRAHEEDMKLLRRGEGSSEIESLRTGPDGRPQWLIVRKVVLRRADGTLTGLVGSNTDITHLKRVEQELADEGRRLELVVRASKLGTLDWDGINRTVYYSPRFREMLGHPPGADTSAWPDFFEGIVYPEDRARVEKLFRDHVLGTGPGGATERHPLLQYRLRRADGSPVWVEAQGVAVRNEKGYVTRFTASFSDITERRAHEESLASERRQLDLVVRAAKAGIVDWDGFTHATYYSPRFREILGHAPDADTSGWPDYFKVLMHPDDREHFTRRWQMFVRGKGPEGPRGEFLGPEEHRLLRKDGSYVWVEVNGVAVRNEEGFVTRWIAATTDITERRAQQEALRESVRLREEVERMSRHDLKTPLNSVIAVSRLLRDGAKLPAEDEELLSIVERAGYRILNMVNLSLDLFRMEQGSYQFRPQAVDLTDVADKVAADLFAQAESKSVAVRVKRLGSANTAEGAVLARAEELLCYSMLANVVKNAIEAAPPRTEVTIGFDRSPEAVQVHVHNIGAVPADLRARFFQKYATSGKSGGLGIGTYSARLMARVQGGDAAMHTSDAEGTTISIRLGASTEPFTPKRATPEQVAAAAASLPRLPEMSVLIVDDDEFNRLVVRRYLPTPPLKVAMAVNGLAALEAAKHEWPDAILLDLEMPVMHGYEAAKKLREIERREKRKRVNIIAFSSNDDPAIVQRALDAGCDRYVVKPVPRHVLWNLLIGKGERVIAPARLREARASDIVVVDEDLRGAIPEFLASRRKILDQMPAALKKDRALFRRLAHRIAGSCSLYGFTWAAAAADALEDAAAKAKPKDLLAQVSALREHFERVRIDYAAARSAAR